MKGYTKYKYGKQVKSAENGEPDMQGSFAKNEEQERVDNYAKPGTDAANRQAGAWDTSFPTSRYRSRRP